MLSSDILEAQFGPTKVTVLQHNQFERIITTSIASTGQVLELSRVLFSIGALERYPAVTNAMAAGTSMGTAFRQHAIHFERKELCRYSADLPAAFTSLFAAANPCTILEVEWFAEYNLFATIFEVYSLAVDWSADYPLPHHKRLNLVRQRTMEALLAYTT